MSNDKTVISFGGSDSSDLLSMLVAQGALTEEQAEQVRRRTRRARSSSHQAVLDLGFATQEIVYRTLSEANGLPFVLLSKEEILPEATEKVPAKVALHYQFVPLSVGRGTLKAAFAAPPTIRDRENLRLLLGLRLDPSLATPNEVSATLKRVYGLGAEKVI